MDNPESVPLVDLSPLFDGSFPTSPSSAATAVIQDIDRALRTWGFFHVKATPLPSATLTQELADALSRFFALPAEQKRALGLRQGGWGATCRFKGRPQRDARTPKGRPDAKEGFYGGPEHAGHPLDGLPTYGKNLFPDSQVPEMRAAVLEYTERVTELGSLLCDVMSVALGLDAMYIRTNLLEKPDPVQLFRAFHYVGREGQDDDFGIGEHSGALAVWSWVAVPHIPGSFVVNAGDILDRLTTSGVYRSVAHRVILPSPSSTRLSIPFFFDPAWNAEMKPFPLPTPPTSEVMAAAEERWKKTTFRSLDGVWGQYLGVKVKKVFPDLVLPEFDAVERGSGRHVLVVRKDDVSEGVVA